MDTETRKFTAENRNLGWLLRQDEVPVSEAAGILGIAPKRLLGFMARNSVADPIGDWSRVYGWSCGELAKRLSDMTSPDTSSGSRE